MTVEFVACPGTLRNTNIARPLSGKQDRLLDSNATPTFCASNAAIFPILGELFRREDSIFSTGYSKLPSRG